MKLKNRSPADFVGRTIIYRHHAWHIDSVTDTEIHLSQTGVKQKGRMQH